MLKLNGAQHYARVRRRRRHLARRRQAGDRKQRDPRASALTSPPGHRQSAAWPARRRPRCLPTRPAGSRRPRVRFCRFGGWEVIGITIGPRASALTQDWPTIVGRGHGAGRPMLRPPSGRATCGVTTRPSGKAQRTSVRPDDHGRNRSKRQGPGDTRSHEGRESSARRRPRPRATPADASVSARRGGGLATAPRCGRRSLGSSCSSAGAIRALDQPALRSGGRAL